MSAQSRVSYECCEETQRLETNATCECMHALKLPRRESVASGWSRHHLVLRNMASPGNVKFFLVST